jgi:hypothetical protein
MWVCRGGCGCVSVWVWVCDMPVRECVSELERVLAVYVVRESVGNVRTCSTRYR